MKNNLTFRYILQKKEVFLLIYKIVLNYIILAQKIQIWKKSVKAIKNCPKLNVIEKQCILTMKSS